MTKIHPITDPKQISDNYFWHTRALGKKLIDVEFQHDGGAYREDSATILFTFEDGTEIAVYGNGKGVLFIEED